MFCFLFMIFLFCIDGNLTRVADKLDFWDPSPSTAWQNVVEFKSKPIKNVTNEDDKTQFYFKKVKGSGPISIQKIKGKHNKTANASSLNDSDHFEPITKTHYRAGDRGKKDHYSNRNDKHHDNGDNQNYHDTANRFGNLKRSRTEQSAKKWPKVQNRYQKKTREGEDKVRSTRMTPVYLMQHEHETTKPDDSLEDIRLSPYSMKKDMLHLVDKFPEANITIEVIGRTAEYSDIVMLKVSERKSEISKYFRADDSKYIDEVPEKKIVLIVHGLSVMGINLVSCLSYLKDFKTLMSYYLDHLDKFDIFLIPLANPDGFTQRNSIWNKNLSPQGACSGVTLDRNFDVWWNHSHEVSSCSQHYPGPTPFSEPETRAVREVLHHYSHKIYAYFHVHAGTYAYDNFKGDAVLYPKGYTDVQTDDDKYIDLRGEIDEAMKNASFQVISVTVDTLHNWYGKVTGSSVDYASSVYGVPYAMELVMQPYETSNGIDYGDIALGEIWERLIDVIFNNLAKNIKTNDI